MYFTSCIGDAIRISLRLTLSLLSCFSLGVVQLTGAAPMTKSSIIAEQYLGLHLQTLKIFFPSSDSKVSRSILTGQPNHAEILMASPKRLYTCCISFLLYMLYIYIVHWAHGFVPLVSPWKKKRRNFNFHLSSFSNSYSWSTRLRDSSIIAL